MEKFPRGEEVGSEEGEVWQRLFLLRPSLGEEELGWMRGRRGVPRTFGGGGRRGKELVR